MCAFLSPRSRWNYLFRNQQEADNEQKKRLEHPFNVTEWKNVDSDYSFSHLLPGCLVPGATFWILWGWILAQICAEFIGAHPDPPVRLKKLLKIRQTCVTC